MRVLKLKINGDLREVAAPEHWTLLEVLRYALGLTGSKQGCDKGDCGACTVLVDGMPVLSCLVPVGQVEGRAVRTVEGLAEDGRLDPIQAAFVDSGGVQCGICTPGILMSARAFHSLAYSQKVKTERSRGRPLVFVTSSTQYSNSSPSGTKKVERMSMPAYCDSMIV